MVLQGLYDNELLKRKKKRVFKNLYTEPGLWYPLLNAVSIL